MAKGNICYFRAPLNNGHNETLEGFIEWVESEKLLAASQVIVEWVDRNPLAHSDPQYAPVGNFMFTGLDCCVKRVHA